METFKFWLLAGKNQEFLTDMRRGKMPPLLFSEGRDESHVEPLIISSGISNISYWLMELEQLAENPGKTPLLFSVEQILKFHYIYPSVPRAAFRHIIAGWQRRRPDLRGYAILDAHGSMHGREWFYDGKELPKGSLLHSVQSWVNEHDGKELVLLIFCCNEGNCSITSKESIVIHFDGKVATGDDHDCEEDGIIALSSVQHKGIRFYLPWYGYLENKSSTELRKIIRSLPKSYLQTPSKVS